MNTNHVKLSLSIKSVIHEALKIEAEAKNLDVPSIIQRVLHDHVMGTPYLDPSVKDREAEFWSLVDQAVKVAEEIYKYDGASSDITAKACAKCADDPNWRARYEAYIGGPAFAKGNPEKGPINREIGFRIRAALNAEVRTKPDGGPDPVKVPEGIIQSYTPFARVHGESVRG